MNIFASIILKSIIPIFVLIFLGYIADKKFKLDMNTLTKINFYLFVPAFSFANIYSTDISSDLVRVIALNSVFLGINFAFGATAAKLLKLPKKTGKAFENSIMFYNSGNIGVSLMTLVFSNPPFVVDGAAPYLETALAVQIMTLLVQNVTTNTIGFVNSGGEGMNLKSGIARVAKMPTLYAVIFAVLLKFAPFDFTANPIWTVFDYLRNGMVSVALVTLGVQLSKTKINLKMKLPYLAVFCRLICGPAAAFALIKLFGFGGVTAQAIFIASSAPTAVNTALLSAECKGDSEFAVQTVTISTLLSAATMTTAVYLAYILF
ncbi:MAG: AEC family transporter [Oscillospiraceae bacterium]|nr:AEC family transporter [Oscillospiraceae bacterium]